MSEKVVQFGQDAGFFRRRAAALRAERPVDAMKFLMRALSEDPMDGEAAEAAADIALEAGRPRLALRYACRAVDRPRCDYIIGAALRMLACPQPALTALSACLQNTEDEGLRDEALREIYRIRRSIRHEDRWDAARKQYAQRLRQAFIDERSDKAARLAAQGEGRYPDGECDVAFWQAAFAQGRIGAAAWMQKENDGTLPIVRRKGGTAAGTDGIAAMRAHMLAGSWEKVSSYPDVSGAEAMYLRAAAKQRMGAKREEYLPDLLDMAAMDPLDPVADRCLRLIAADRDREMPRLYGVGREAREDLVRRLRSDDPDDVAVYWGLMRRDLCREAADKAGEILLRNVLADPMAPGYCRFVAGTRLKTDDAVGVTTRKLWVGLPFEPDDVHVTGAGYKVLRMAMEVCPQEMNAELFAAWSELLKSRELSKVARDPDGWAAALAAAARDLQGEHKTIMVNESRRSRVRAKSLVAGVNRRKENEVH